MADFLIPYSDTAAAGARLPASVRDEIRTTGPTVIVPVSGETPAQARARINSALAAVSSYGQRRAVVLIGDFLIDASLVIFSDTVLDLTNANVKLADNANANILKNRAVSTVVRSFTATTTVGSTTVTATGSAFTSADVGRSIVIDTAGAGLSGTGGGFTSTIVSVTDATTIVVKSAPLKAVSAQAARLYDRDRNITILGGTVDYGTQNGSVVESNDLHLTRWRRIDGFRWHRPSFKSVSGKYAAFIADCSDILVTDPFFDVNSDGIHLMGPIQNATVRGAKGKTGDDTVVAGCGDYSAYQDVVGDMNNIVFQDVQSRCLYAPGKIFNGTAGHWINGVLLDGFYPESVNNYCLDLGTADLNGAANIRNITIRNIEAAPINAGALMILQGSGFGSVTIENIRTRSGSTANLVSLTSGTVIDSLKIRNAAARQGNAAQVLYAPTGCTITNLLMSECDAYGIAGTSGRLANLGGTFGWVVFERCQQNAGYDAILLNSATPMQLMVRSCKLVSTIGVNHNGTVNHMIMLDDVTYDCSQGLLRFNNNSATGVCATVHYGSIHKLNGSAVGRSASQRLRALNVPSHGTYDLSWNNAANPGDTNVNRNAALSCGEGLCVFDGTVWKNIATAATYAPA